MINEVFNNETVSIHQTAERREVPSELLEEFLSGNYQALSGDDLNAYFRSEEGLLVRVSYILLNELINPWDGEGDEGIRAVLEMRPDFTLPMISGENSSMDYADLLKMMRNSPSMDEMSIERIDMILRYIARQS